MSDTEKTIDQPSNPTDSKENQLKNDNNESLNHYLLIFLNEEKYFIPLPLIIKIINPLEIFPLPDTLDFIAGVSNFSGEIIPIVHLKKVLKLPDHGPSPWTKFIICKYKDMKVGFILDRVIDSREIDNSRIKTETTRVLENEFISGEFIYKDDVISIIDLVKFINTHKAN